MHGATMKTIKKELTIDSQVINNKKVSTPRRAEELTVSFNLQLTVLFKVLKIIQLILREET
jgi:hypothetical protein